MLKQKTKLRKATVWIIVVITGAWTIFGNINLTQAAALTSAKVTISDPRPGQASTTYTLAWTFPATTSIGCIEAKFTTTATGAAVPTGIVTTSAAKGTLTGGGLTTGDWITTVVTSNGTVQLKHATTEATTTTAFTLGWTGITNPTNASGLVFFAQLNTYTGSGACTGLLDSAVVALATTAAVTVSATVDPSLSFAVAGIAAETAYKSAGLTTSASCTDSATAVTFPSTMAAATNYNCAQQLTVTTNAGGGYTVTIRGTASGNDLVSTSNGSNEITDHTGTNASPAVFGTPTEGFGYTTSDSLSATGDGAARFSTAADRWAGMTNTASEVAYNAGAASAETTDIGFQIRFGTTTEAGTYQGTVVYTATPTF